MAKRKAGSPAKGQYKDLIDIHFTQMRKRLGGQIFENVTFEHAFSPEVAAEFRERYSNLNVETGRRNQAFYDYTAQKAKLREKGTLKYIPIAERELSGCMPRGDVVNFLFYANCLIPSGGYDAMDEHHWMIAAAAVWLLDRLMQQKQLDELYRILLAVDIPGDFTEVPLFRHPVHPDHLIIQLTLLLAHRNDGLYDPSPIPTPWADEWTLTPVAERKSTEGYPLRQAFEAIMALVDPQAAADAAKRYEKNIWDVYRLAAATECQCKKELNSLQYQMEAVRKQQGIPRLAPPAAAVTSLPPLRISAANSAELDRLQQRSNRIERVFGSLGTSICLSNNREKDLKPLKGIVSDDVLEGLIHYSVGDPYETAFALLWLLDSGSMLPWAYYGSLTVFANALDQLPFNALTAFPTFEVSTGSLPPEDAYGLRYPYHRWYNRLDAENEPVQRRFGMNLNQILFRCTGHVLPRLTSTCSYVDEDEATGLYANDPESLLALLELETGKEKLLASVLLDLLNANWLDFHHDSELLYKMKSEEEEPQENPAEENDAAEMLEACRKENQGLKKRLEAMQTQQHCAALENRHLKQENEQLKKEQQQLRLQLHDLRTIAFQQNSGGSTEESAEPQLQFPVQISKKIAAYGGHATWLNRIRTLLPDVRFVAPDLQPNELLFQHAEEIWIQPNCLSHSAFYKLADIARKNHIPLRYFAYTSAEKCAEQLALACKET